MFLTLALVIFAAAILVLFSQELISMIKKIFAIKGAKLILPLAIGSWLVCNFEFWVLWFLYYLREVLEAIKMFLTQFIPFQQGASSLVLILLLTVISVVPVMLLDLYIVKKTFKHYKYPYFTSFLIWVVSFAVLLVTI